MSRIGKKSIVIPEKVKIKLDGQKVSVDGPKGSLSRILPSLVCCTMDENGQNLFMEKTQDTKLSQSLYGLSRTLVANMVKGVSVGFEKKTTNYRCWLSSSTKWY
jgi:large subunit ribosomal protein L6